MNLSAPKNLTFWIAVVIAVIGLIAFFGVIPGFAAYAFWIMLVAFVLLALGNLIGGL